jgi:methyl-accepting chemotaxis protein
VFRRLSIRAVLGGIILAMGALLIVLAGLSLQTAIQHNRAAQGVGALATLDGHVFDALLAMRTERGTMQGALLAAGPAAAASVARIADFRAQSEAGYSLAANGLSEAAAATPALDRAIAQLHTARDAMANLRTHADTMILQDRGARDPAVVQSAAAVLQAYQDALVAVGDQLESAIKLVSPAVDQLMAIKQMSWAARLYSGGLALRMETAVAAGRPWQLADYVGGAEDRGRMGLAWLKMSEITGRPEIPHAVKEAVARAGEVFPTGFENQIAEAVKGIEHPGPSVLPLTEWQTRDGIAFGLLNDVGRVTLREVGILAGSQASAAQRLLMLSIGTLVAALGLTLGGYLIAARRISAPISAMTDAMRRLAAHDLSAETPGIGRGDEIGGMAAAVQVFKDNMIRTDALERQQAEARERRVVEDQRVRGEAEAAAAAGAATLVVGSIGLGLERLAAGDLTFRLDTALPGSYEILRANLNAALEELHQLVRSIVANTSAIRSGTDEITRASDDLSRRTEQQAASLEETAAALDQITATVRRTAEGATQAREVVSRTRVDAERSGEVVRQAVAAMDGIERSSQQIGEIIGVIDEIAFQTNLLALNAGIEAARAGDSGRGFAVVASEVRALAQRSAQAAKEIKTLISTSTRQVGVGVKLVGETGQALDRIVAQVGEITVVVSEIAGSAQEQATGLQEVNTAINQMDQVTQQNAAMVEQSTAASHALAQETADLARLTERFQIGEPLGARTSVPVARRRSSTVRAG